MKAATLSNRPDFNLMKQTDIQSFYHLQMPRWLFFDKKYMPLSLEAKVTYTFLLNRFQLSRLNNWINDDGEVFIIYTRESLAEEMQISYRRVIGCMKELSAMNLIWERRCGRGDANQIYLAQVVLTNESASVYNSTPFVRAGDEAADSRSAETACLDQRDAGSNAAHGAVDERPFNSPSPERPAEAAHQASAYFACQDLQKAHVKTCENGTSRSAESAYQDLHNSHTSNIDSNNNNKSYIDSQSVGLPRAREKPDGRTDDEIAELDDILEGCELYAFPPETAKVFESAIERLYFSESYRIGNCVLPQQKVRSHLRALDFVKLQTAEIKISRNTEKEIRNSTAYTMAVIFNSIWETESDLINDPYLNSLRQRDAGPNVARGAGREEGWDL